MPLIQPYLPRPPDVVTPPVQSDTVPPITAVKDREARRDSSGERRRKRRALLDLLMQEVEAIPDLDPPHKERIRRNMRDFVRRETIRPKPAQGGEGVPEETVGQNPVHADEDHAGPILRAALSPPSAEEQEQIEEAARLEGEFRRCLALHTERARNIAAYIHALQTLESAPHLVTVEA